MAHYAFLDENNIVTEVIVGKDEGEEGVDWEAHYGAFRGQPCKRTSYNTHREVFTLAAAHLTARTMRALVTHTMRSVTRLFSLKPFASWLLNETLVPVGTLRLQS
jgi:hypothetical protein